MNSDQLIFLISPPRSGSSMLQQLICSNDTVHSLPEPWFMLSLINLFKKDSPISFNGFNHNGAIINRDRYLKLIPDGAENFKKRVKQLALDTYSDAFYSEKEKRLFLDKTPRYYHIIEELMDWFPNAKFILLVRNPLSVFTSIMDYNFDGKLDWLSREDRRHDIISSFEQVEKFKDLPKTHFVRYEDLVTNPVQCLTDINAYLGFEQSDKITQYEVSKEFKGSISIDTKSVHKHNKPVKDYLENWRKSVDTKQKKRLLLEYLELLDSTTLSNLGYNKNELKTQCLSLNPKKGNITFPFRFFTNNNGQGLKWFDKIYMKMISKSEFVW